MFRTLSQLDVIKASVSDTIPNLILKRCAPELAGPLTSLYKKCFAAGSFPKAWKTAYVAPVPKAEFDLTIVGLYRPISMLSCVKKVYESVITKNLYQYLESHTLLADMQYGFHRKQ